MWMVEEKELPKVFQLSQSSVRGLTNKEGATEFVLLYPQDFSPKDREQVVERIRRGVQRGEGGFIFSVVKGNKTPEISVQRFSELKDLTASVSAAIPNDRPRCRYVAFQQTVILYVPPPNADEERMAAASRFGKNSTERVKELKAAGDDTTARGIAGAIIKDTDGFFTAMSSQNLFTERMQSYDVLWQYQLKRSLMDSPRAKEIISTLDSFGENLLASTDPKVNGTKCTVEVISKPDFGATIKYAKEVDAKRGVFKVHSRPTMDTFEIERAKYHFQTHRGMKLTGEKGPIDCLGERQSVVIEEK